MSDSNKIAIRFWEELQLGNKESLGGLYDLFADDLYAYGTQFASDKSCIMDAIHDLFLDLYKYRKNLAATDNVKYYLLRSLKNKLIKTKQPKVIILEKELFSGSLDVKESVDQVLKIIQLTSDFDYTINNNIITIN